MLRWCGLGLVFAVSSLAACGDSDGSFPSGESGGASSGGSSGSQSSGGVGGSSASGGSASGGSASSGGNTACTTAPICSGCKGCLLGCVCQGGTVEACTASCSSGGSGAGGSGA